MSRPLWKKTSDYCPGCGQQEVYVEAGAGDYYDGPTFGCLACGERGKRWKTNGPLFEEERKEIEASIDPIARERPLSRMVREEQARPKAANELARPKYEQRDGYRVRVRR